MHGRVLAALALRVELVLDRHKNADARAVCRKEHAPDLQPTIAHVDAGHLATPTGTNLGGVGSILAIAVGETVGGGPANGVVHAVSTGPLHARARIFDPRLGHAFNCGGVRERAQALAHQRNSPKHCWRVSWPDENLAAGTDLPRVLDLYWDIRLLPHLSIPCLLRQHSLQRVWGELHRSFRLDLRGPLAGEHEVSLSKSPDLPAIVVHDDPLGLLVANPELVRVKKQRVDPTAPTAIVLDHHAALDFARLDFLGLLGDRHLRLPLFPLRSTLLVQLHVVCGLASANMSSHYLVGADNRRRIPLHGQHRLRHRRLRRRPARPGP
mmetsp:Transcript_2591/g.7487  ORF Transcript_2591/g.7487 Transcript_2591/m.7487 type:complete len:324 (-) Transcript_2591:334-1305(-)